MLSSALVGGAQLSRLASEALTHDCKRVCSNSCALARDGRCSDGGSGDDSPEGNPRCALGSDCGDCGARNLCTLPGTRLKLSAAALPASPRPLKLEQVLFMVMGSRHFRERTRLAYHSWCADDGVRCLFFEEGGEPHSNGVNESGADIGGGTNRMPVPRVHVIASPPPHTCCHSRGRAPGFFCDPHRAITLPAQYRFLPALHVVRSSKAFLSGSFRWVVIVDDDSFVFTRHIRWLLSRLNHSMWALFWVAQCYHTFCIWLAPHNLIRATRCSSLYPSLFHAPHASNASAFPIPLCRARAKCNSTNCCYNELDARLQMSLASYDSPFLVCLCVRPLYVGDFGSSGDAVKMHIPYFACGGAGSVLSEAALRRMDVLHCLHRYHLRCMQSDWMIGSSQMVTFLLMR